MKKITFSLAGVECPNCILKLEGIEDQLPGIKWVEGSYRKSQLRIEFEPDKVSIEQIRDRVQSMGYQVVNIE